MPKSWICPGCARRRRSSFCPDCGEGKLRERDLSLNDIARQFAKGFSSVDGKLLRSSRAVVTKPGALTDAYVRGERRRFLAPLGLFLIANALFAGIQSLTGTNVLSSPLQSHLQVQDWHELARSLVEQRLVMTGKTVADYSQRFDRAAIFNAKALMILMVMAFAPIAALSFRGRHKAAGVHVVFALHIYTFVFLLLCVSVLLAEVEHLVGGDGLRSPTVDTVLSVFNLAACFGYIYLAIGPAYGARGTSRFASAVALTACVGVLFVGYRFLIFLITLYSTS